jgi:DNA repair exonuclease SbcCD nuclease subunit
MPLKKMVKTLLLGDIHISNKDEALRQAQIACVSKIFKEVNPDEVIQLGDFLDFRKPSPEALLAAKSIIDFWKEKATVVILRGNHCASTKADDGVTALSVFEEEKVKIVIHTWFDHKTKRAFIPHYENEKIITDALRECPKEYTVFGHFGYYGCLNSVGDFDFNINVNNFRNNTILGHIHRQNERVFKHHGEQKYLLILGTPYTTNFGESEKQNYYGILEEDKITLHEIKHGPRHLTISNKDVPSKLDLINDVNYCTYLRIILEPGEVQVNFEGIEAHSVDVKYSQAFDEEMISQYSPSRDLFKLNEVIIEDYLDSANSSISKEKLLKGYNLLRYED